MTRSSGTAVSNFPSPSTCLPQIRSRWDFGCSEARFVDILEDGLELESVHAETQRAQPSIRVVKRAVTGPYWHLAQVVLLVVEAVVLFPFLLQLALQSELVTAAEVEVSYL